MRDWAAGKCEVSVGAAVGSAVEPAAGSAAKPATGSEAEPENAVFGAPYPPYDAPSFASFAELVSYLGDEFPDRVAFERADGERVTYRRLVETIAQLEAEFAREATGRWVDVRDPDPVRFAARYLAATASGRCAVLCPLDDAQRAALESPAAVPDPIRTVVASSGTSSDPKAVMLSEAGILADLTAGLELYRFADGARYAKLLPYTHAFGLVCDLLAPLVTGGTICVPHSPATFAAELPRMAVDALNLPPRASGMLAQALDGPRYRLPTLKKILCGGAGLASSLTRRLRAHGIEAFGCYGLTECSPCVTVNRDAWRKDGSCGVALACNEVATAPDGSILVRGVNVMAGYLGRPDLTAACLSAEGWLRTGDVGRVDGDGFLYVDGRADDLIVLSDGTKVSPEPLERALQAHPAVAEALVFGAGDEGSRVLGCRLVLRKTAGTEAESSSGTASAASTAPTPTASDAASEPIEFAQSLRSPQGARIELVEVTEEPLPRTPAGKIRR